MLKLINKKKIIAVQADKLEKINIKTDTTVLLCLEAQKRGFKIFWYQPESLTFIKNEVFAKGHYVDLFESKNNFFKKKKYLEFNLIKSKYLLIRQNPPFNMDYINSTLYLDKISKYVKIINNPFSIRNISEKFYSSKYLEYMPPTIFTKDSDRILKFFKQYNKVVIKPLNGYAGKGIIFINNKFNKKKIITYLKKTGHVMVQKFIPKVIKGDKRVFIINGKVMGVIKRVPSKNSILSNLSQGGTAIKTSLNLQEKKISKIIAKDLLKNNIYFAGIDFVSGYIIGDINITSPTGLPQYKEISGIDLSSVFWDGLKKLK